MSVVIGRESPQSPSAGPPPLGRLGLAVALGGSLVVILDFSIVNVALPTISGAMGVTTTTSEWVITAYALTFGGLLVLGGRASDFFGRRRMLVAGLVLFAIASAAGGVAANLPLLAVTRAVQGVAAALVAPAALSTLTTSYPEGPARNRVLGYFGMTASAGFVVGLVAGGILVDTVGWRGVFFVNVPVCLALALVGSKALPAGTTTAGPRHLDLPGAALVTSGTAVLVYAPTIGTTDGWTSLPFVGCLMVSAVLLGAFVFVEGRSRQPLLPLRIFRHHTLLIGDTLSGLLGAWMAGEVLVLSLFCQQVLGYSPLVSGLVALPQGIGGLLRGVLGSRLLDRVGLRAFLAGNCVLAAVSALALFRFPITTRYPGLGIVLLAFGFASTNVVFGATVAASTGVTNDEQGLAGALVNATRQIGAAVGVAGLLSIVAIDASAHASTAHLADGYRLALACAAGLAAAATLLSLRIPAGRATHDEAEREKSTGQLADQRVAEPVSLIDEVPRRELEEVPCRGVGPAQVLDAHRRDVIVPMLDRSGRASGRTLRLRRSAPPQYRLPDLRGRARWQSVPT